MTPKEKKLKELKKEAWINNVMKIYPARTREEVDDLFNKIFSIPKELVNGEQTESNKN